MNGPLVVFVGPSCPRSVVLGETRADVRPPARRGDVQAARAEGAEVIVLIDGYLVHDYPPSPAEVAEVVTDGAWVLGGASLGALRAVELRHHGVEGLGWVYRRYLDGTINADDEVVVEVDPLSGAPTSVPLVRVRYALECLGGQGVVTASDAERVIHQLRRVYFADRTAAEVMRTVRAAGLGAEIARRIFDDRFDIKRADTVSALRRGLEVARACGLA